MKSRKQDASGPSKASRKHDASGENHRSVSGSRAGTKTDSFPIVGIGASAGGLEAVEQFLSSLPTDTGMAFVLVSHLDPHHRSVLAELLAQRTTVRVLQIEDGMRVEADHLYVIPPNCYLHIENHVLRLADLEPQRSLRMPIDYFLRSLAEQHRENAIAVILSGNGTDGTLGIRAVNGSGGIAFVQDPATAKFEGMPRSAVATGLADFVLPPAAMPEHLIEYLQHFGATHSSLPGPPPVSAERLTPLHRIYTMLRARTGNDFSRYKRSTVARRIERRMSIRRLEDPAKYARFLEENPDEVQVLFRELLIGVTSFFRDPEAFDALKGTILPYLLKDKPDYSPVRIWVPGCASGEEAYSIAMVLHEYMDEQKRAFNVQIFGTDLDPQAIAAARLARFPSNIALDVSPERLQRFFEKDETGYRVKNEIREDLIFAEHNVLQDAPFTRLDLLSCRNLLIYLEIDLQNRLLPIFHFTLRPGGVLFLGTAESIGSHLNLFLTIDKRWKFFQRRDGRHQHLALAMPLKSGKSEPAEPENREVPSSLQDHDILGHTRQMLLERFSPPCVVTTEKGDVLYIHGQIGRYLDPMPGRMSTNIIDMVREGLRLELRMAIGRAAATQGEYVCRPVPVEGDAVQFVRMAIRPCGREGLMWVVFEEVEVPPVVKLSPRARRRASQSRESELEQELQQTLETFQTTSEELQAANEELRSANEELQSINEEHQSTNEELETSKEELQSLNEELISLNSELSAKVEQANRVENDLKNLLDSLRVGVIFLDTEMRIVRYTPEATRLVKLIPSDLGRPIGDLVSYLPNLEEHARAVLDKLVPREMEVQTDDRTWFLMRLMPYRTLDNVITGVVLTFDDITAGKKADENARHYIESILDTIRLPFLVLDSGLRVRSANAAFYDLFQVRAEDTIGERLYNLGNRQWNIPALRQLLENLLAESKDVNDYVVEHTFPTIGPRRMVLNAHLVEPASERDRWVFLAMRNVADVRE
jgi:two-component system, chemotaxis family, CheB/CheR fusion protein